MRIFLAGFQGRRELPEQVEEDMRIYMAGAVTGNLKPLFSRLESREKEEIYRELKVFLAGGRSYKKEACDSDEFSKLRPFVLESFFYADETVEKQIPYFDDFMLDSGAFTFMQNSKTQVNWDEYIEKYCDFILRNKVEKFFELDIDSVVGYKKVKELRNKIENLVGRQCIPVWHVSRGIKEWEKMCKEYKYVAIGGIVSGEIPKDKYKLFPPMITFAHQHGCKVHGLGFTNLSLLSQIHFDSVDSTAWVSGNRFGHVYYFDGQTMKKKLCPQGKRLGDSRKVALINYVEWIKYQKWAEVHL